MLDEVDGDDSDGEGTKSIDVSSVGLFLESVSPVLEGHFFANSQIRILSDLTAKNNSQLKYTRKNLDQDHDSTSTISFFDMKLSPKSGSKA